MDEPAHIVQLKNTIIDEIKYCFRMRSVASLENFLADDISWMDDQINNSIIGKEKVFAYLSSNLNTNYSYTTISHDIRATQLSDKWFLSELSLRIMNDYTRKEAHLFFSLVIEITNEIKISHVHMSLPKFYTENSSIENELMTQSELLVEKSTFIDDLVQNIVGGVQFCHVDEPLTMAYVSNRFEELSGYTLDEINEEFNGSYKAMIYSLDYQLFVNAIEEQLKKGNSFYVRYRIVHKDGHLVWIDDRGILTRSKNGVAYYQCILNDITDFMQQQENVMLNEKRYEIATKLAEMMIFEYDILTKQLIFLDDTSQKYGVGNILDNGVEVMIESGHIEKESIDDYRELYRKIDAGEPYATAIVGTMDVKGELHYFEIKLVTIFDADGIPIRAVGIRKNISQLKKLQQEEEYARNIVQDKILVLEANVDKDKIEYSDFDKAFDQDINGESYLEVVNSQLLHLIYTEDQKTFTSNLCPKNLHKMYSEGITYYEFKYRRYDKSSNLVWHSASINIIKDQYSNDLYLRIYRKDITEEVKIEKKSSDISMILEAILQKAEIAYEINFSTNTMISGHEYWERTYNIAFTSNYEEMISIFASKAVHPDYQKGFRDVFSNNNVTRRYNEGIRQLSYEYLRRDQSGAYVWVLATLNLVEDIDKYIRGVIYIENIDERKSLELMLLYKSEHDEMTGLYNRSTTEKKIKEKIAFNKYSKHAMLLIDIDLFKTINDTYGHLVGDEVIIYTANKISKLFRDSDVIGRAGGDEFVVFMYNIESEEIAFERAKTICEMINDDKNEVLPPITTSIGVAIYPKMGNDFYDLFMEADKALYLSKEQGRNRVS